MKYYLYISDAKVDMLLSQIGDAEKRTISNEIGIDLKLFAAKRKIEYDGNSERIARLEAVTSFIRQFGNLGTIEYPDEYIEDSLPMHSVFLGREGRESGRLAYFTGTHGNTVIGLGGSMKHLFGAEPTNSHESGSYSYAIIMALEEDNSRSDFQKKYSETVGLEGVESFAKTFAKEYPTENLRFMAKRLIVKTNHKTVILGTPLYVAKED